MSLFGCHKGSVLSAAGRSGLCVDERRSVMLYAAIDIHKHAFQAAVLDPETGVVVEERFAADRESLTRWAEPWRGRVVAVAIEATTGWRWVWRELVANGFEVRLAEPVQTRALLGRRGCARRWPRTGAAGSAPARLPAARGLALLALESAPAAGVALGGRAPAL